MKMKKLSSIMVAFAACVMMLTSCLDGNSDGNKKSGFEYGVIGTINYTTPVIYLNDVPIYSPEIAKDYMQGYIKDKDCIVYAYEIDFDSEANADANSKGYITATVSGWDKLPTTSVLSSLQDTTKLLNSETTLASLGLSIYFSQNMFFFNPVFAEIYQDQKNAYQVSLNMTEEPEKVNGERIYYLYVRTMITDPGKTNSSSYKNQGEVATVDLNTFLTYAYRQEQSANEKNVYIKFRYPTAFNSDSTGIKSWGTSEKLTFAIPTNK